MFYNFFYFFLYIKKKKHKSSHFLGNCVQAKARKISYEKIRTLKTQNENGQYIKVFKKGGANMVYIDLKSNKMIPHLKPLEWNFLYAKRKFN